MLKDSIFTSVFVSLSHIHLWQPSDGSTPNSVSFPFESYIGDALNLTVQPLGNSEVKGIPQPPPVISPTMRTLGKDFIIEAKLFVCAVCSPVTKNYHRLVVSYAALARFKVVWIFFRKFIMTRTCFVGYVSNERFAVHKASCKSFGV